MQKLSLQFKQKEIPKAFKAGIKRKVPRLPESFVPNTWVKNSEHGQNAGYNQVALNTGYKDNGNDQADSNYIEEKQTYGNNTQYQYAGEQYQNGFGNIQWTYHQQFKTGEHQAMMPPNYQFCILRNYVIVSYIAGTFLLTPV